jgi:hypothetical protein
VRKFGTLKYLRAAAAGLTRLPHPMTSTITKLALASQRAFIICDSQTIRLGAGRRDASFRKHL